MSTRREQRQSYEPPPSSEVSVECESELTVFKVLIIGDTNVGKTALLRRFCDGDYPTTFISTVGIDYKTRVISLDEESVKLQIWDTAGQERFRTLTNAYFRGAAGAVLLYDITSRPTFSNVVGWMDSVMEHGAQNIRLAVVGNKLDLDDDREVSIDEGKKLADNFDCLFFESSAKEGTNCNTIFTQLAQEIKSAQEVSQTNGSHDDSALSRDPGWVQPKKDSRPPSSSSSSSCC